MARAIADVPQYPARTPQPNGCYLPFRIVFASGTINAASTVLPPGMKFSSKTGTGVYRFVVPAASASYSWYDGKTTANTIVSFPSAPSIIPTGLLDIQTGTTAATTATDPSDGVILNGYFFAGWGR